MCDRQNQKWRNQDATGAGAVQRQAERQAALAIEPKPDHIGDGADMHRGGAHRHQQVHEIKLPKLGDDREQRHRAAEAAGANQHHQPRPESGDRVADEHHQCGGE